MTISTVDKHERMCLWRVWDELNDNYGYFGVAVPMGAYDLDDIMGYFGDMII